MITCFILQSWAEAFNPFGCSSQERHGRLLTFVPDPFAVKECTRMCTSRCTYVHVLANTSACNAAALHSM